MPHGVTKGRALTEGRGKKANKTQEGWGEKLKRRKKVVLYLEEAHKNKIKISSLIPSPSVKVSKEESMTLSQSLPFPDELWRSIFLWKFRLNMRKSFFPLRIMEHWNRLPREVVESPSLEILKTRLDAVLCSLLWVTLLRRGVGLDDPQRSLPTPTILWFCVCHDHGYLHLSAWRRGNTPCICGVLIFVPLRLHLPTQLWAVSNRESLSSSAATSTSRGSQKPNIYFKPPLSIRLHKHNQIPGQDLLPSLCRFTPSQRAFWLLCRFISLQPHGVSADSRSQPTGRLTVGRAANTFHVSSRWQQWPMSIFRAESAANSTFTFPDEGFLKNSWETSGGKPWCPFWVTAVSARTVKHRKSPHQLLSVQESPPIFVHILPS